MSYQDQQEVGEGGFAKVVRCDRNGKDFARKYLKPDVPDGAKARFRREVEILASLEHPNIVTIVQTNLAQEPPWFVMPYYQMSLDHELRALRADRGRIPQVFGAILRGVEFAHNKDVVHRDLKPENILMNNDRDVVVADFGIGRFLNLPSDITEPGKGIGSKYYVAPEQLISAKTVGKPADVFSLGRILETLYTGPLTNARPDLSDVPAAIALVIETSTSKQPQRRYQDAGQMRESWQKALVAIKGSSSEDEIAPLAANLGSGGGSRADADRFLELMSEMRADNAFVHRTFMQLAPAAAAELFKYNAELTRELVERFVTYISSRDWGFDYCGTIADRLRQLSTVIPDPETHGLVVVGMLRLGCEYNNYSALRTAVAVLPTVKDEREQAAVATAVGALSRTCQDTLRKIMKERAIPRYLADALTERR